VWEDVGCAGVTTPALSPHTVTTEEARRLGSIGAVKRHSKNDFMRHPTPLVTCPIRREIWQLYLKGVPLLLWSLLKLKV
jgi:hypothetical protein